MAAAVPPRQLEANAIATPSHSPTPTLLCLAARPVRGTALIGLSSRRSSQSGEVISQNIQEQLPSFPPCAPRRSRIFCRTRQLRPGLYTHRVGSPAVQQAGRDLRPVPSNGARCHAVGGFFF